jgi:flagellar biosynthesis/type III secretory pathway protein FliH
MTSLPDELRQIVELYLPDREQQDAIIDELILVVDRRCTEASKNGWECGNRQGYEEGFHDGHDVGYEYGAGVSYNEGFSDGQQVERNHQLDVENMT